MNLDDDLLYCPVQKIELKVQNIYLIVRVPVLFLKIKKISEL